MQRSHLVHPSEKRKSIQGRKRRAVLVTVLFAFGMAFLQHGAYDFLGRPHWLAVFFPLNESVWEHLKLCFYPLILFVLIPITEYQQECSFLERLRGGAMASFLSMLTVFFGYYGMKSGLGITGLAIDIGLLLIGDFLGCFHAYFQCTGTEGKWKNILAFLYIFVFVMMFYWFGVQPPELPLFEPPV